LHQRRGPGAAHGEPLLGARAADLRLDGIDRLQALDHLARERPARRLVHLDELPSGVRKTKGELVRACMPARARRSGDRLNDA
jgi:hypothetical protein